MNQSEELDIVSPVLKALKHFRWPDLSRLFYLQVFCILIVVSIMAMVAGGFMRDRIVEEVELDLEQVARVLAHHVEEHAPDHLWCHKRMLSEMFRLTLIDETDGSVFCDSKVERGNLPKLLDRLEVKRALNQPGFVSSVRQSNTFSEEAFYGAIHIPSRKLILRVGHSLVQVKVALKQVYVVLASGAMILILVIGFMLFGVNRAYFLPKADELIEKKSESLKDEFVANVTHELKTPLTSIKGFAELVEYDCSSGRVPDMNTVKAIQRGVDRMNVLVRDILDLSLLSSSLFQLNVQPVNLDTWTDELMMELSPLLKAKKIKISKVVQAHEMEMDSNRMMQVAINLISNAIRYSPENGEIQLRWMPQGNRVVFQVQDQGPGIPQEHLPFVFDRFHRVEGHRSRDSVKEGSGLGLAIVKRIVELHKGMVAIENHNGALVTCLFPKSQVLT